MAKRKTADIDYTPPTEGGSYLVRDGGELERVEGAEPTTADEPAPPADEGGSSGPEA